MNRHVGASFTLSVLVVVFFAIILFEPDRDPTTAAGPDSNPPTKTAAAEPNQPSTDAPVLSPASTPRPRPEPTPGVPLIEASPGPLLEATRTPVPSPASAPLPPPPPVEPIEPVPTPPTPTIASPTPPRMDPEPPPVIRTASTRRPLRPGRRSAFTQVGEGESLSDVARRVYGTTEAAATLWRANRDIIARREAPLAVGLLLRTP